MRWLSLLLCAITAATITVFLSKVGFVQKAYSSLGAILNANPVLHYSSAFLAGIGIKLLLDKFYISHAKRSIGFNWRYPPVTISVLFGLFFIVSYVYVTYSNEILAQLAAHAFVSFKFMSLSFLAAAATIIYQTKLYKKNPVFSVLLCAISAFYLFSAISLVETEQAFWVFLFIAAAYLGMSVYLLCEQLKAPSAGLVVESKQEAELTLESLENFREWFKDDSIIKNTGQLEPDLQVYAKRITERLLNGGDDYEEDLAQHIALCGPYGCGKSSIVAAIANELKKPKQVKLESPDKEKLKVKQQNKLNWIHSDISTWGAASGSVAHVVLSNIIDDISQHVDVCAFRALPKHYTEAMKSGGGIFQFASTLLAGPIDIEQSFQKLNDVLEVTNHKLLITLQDVDRGTGDENEKRLNDIAALLDRLKNRNLSHINFIVAMGNENEVAAEVTLKATDYKEDILTLDTKRVLVNFIISSLEFAVNYHIKDDERFYILENDKFICSADINVWRIEKLNRLPFYNSVELVDINITSLRVLKKILRRVSQIWQPTGLMGEVNFISLLMNITLKEVSPQKFNSLLQNNSYSINYKRFDLTEFIENISEYEKNSFMFEYFQVMLGLEYKVALGHREQQLERVTNEKEIEKIKKEQRRLIFSNDRVQYQQYILRNDCGICYINRLKLEKLAAEDYSDQEAIRDIRSLFEIEKSDFSKLLPLVTKILSYSGTQKYNFERFMDHNGIFSVEDLNRFKNTIGSELTTQFGKYKAKHSARESIDKILIKTIASNVTIEWLYPLFQTLSTENEWIAQFGRQLNNAIFFDGLLDHINLNVKSTSDDKLIVVLRNGFSKSDLVATTLLFGLLKSFLQGRDKKDIKNDLDSFQFSGIKLTSLLGVNKIEDVINFISNFKEADFRCISNAPELNKDIREFLYKKHTLYQLVGKFLFNAK